MAEKKTTKKATAVVAEKPAKKTTTKKAATVVAEVAPAKKPAAKKAPAKKAATVVYINAESVGFRAGDVYQTLAAAGDKAMTVAEIAKNAKISETEVLLGIGWLFKEGKVTGQDVDLVRLA